MAISESKLSRVNFLKVQNLNFGFENQSPLFENLSFKVPKGARVLLVGANGTGKSTLLRILSGLHLVGRESVVLEGQSPFEDLLSSKMLTWVGGEFGLNLDLKVRELFSEESPRDKKLLNLLDVSLDWSMAKVSDGQRKRVQLLLALRKPTPLILLDEVTAHLDVVVRADLLEYLRTESVKSKTTVVIATHIFDGLVKRKGVWPTHILWLGFKNQSAWISGEILKKKLATANLSELCENWIRRNSVR